MKRICAIVTARPSYSRIKTALVALKNRDDIDLKIILTSSATLPKYGNMKAILKMDGLEVDEEVINLLEGDDKTNMARTTGLAIIELSSVFKRLNPYAVLTVADRYETMATALSAAYMNIPLIHIQGGEVTGNIDEKVRHAITKLSDLHLVSTDLAKERVLKLGEDPKFVFNTGCPSIDIAKEVGVGAALDFDPIAKYGGVGYENCDVSNYIVLLQHPVTTSPENALAQISETIEAMKDLDQTVFWFWPNVDAGKDAVSNGIRKFRENNPNNKFRFFKNMNPDDFLKLISNAKCFVGNSSVGVRESSYLGVPVVNIGDRQNNRQKGKNVKNCDYDAQAIKATIAEQIAHGKYESEHIFGNGNSGKNIANVIASTEITFTKVLQY